jgi:hypothetical protein
MRQTRLRSTVTSGKVTQYLGVIIEISGNTINMHIKDGVTSEIRAGKSNESRRLENNTNLEARRGDYMGTSQRK